MFRIGFIGAGGMARIHSSSFASMDDFEVAAFMDVRPTQAEKAASRFKAKAFDDVERMLQESKIDTVAICTPSAFHHEYAIWAAQNGLNIFLEKPIAMKSSEAEDVIAKCEKAGVTLMVGHVVRFFPQFAQARQRIENGDIGKPVMIRTTRAGRMPRGVANWFSNYKISGGIIMDLLIHDLDYALWCFGPAKRVYAKAMVTEQDGESNTDHKDHAFVIVRFESGVIGHFEASWAMPDGFYTSFEISGDGGLMQFDSRKSCPILVSEASTPDQPKPGVFLPESPLTERPYLTEAKHFANVLRGKEELLVKPEEALEALQLAENAWWSLRTSQPVNLAGGAE